MRIFWYKSIIEVFYPLSDPIFPKEKKKVTYNLIYIDSDYYKQFLTIKYNKINYILYDNINCSEKSINAHNVRILKKKLWVNE